MPSILKIVRFERLEDIRIIIHLASYRKQQFLILNTSLLICYRKRSDVFVRRIRNTSCG